MSQALQDLEQVIDNAQEPAAVRRIYAMPALRA